MFVIDPAGRLADAGAIDDNPSANPADAVCHPGPGRPQGPKTVSPAVTKSYGCSVKYP
jgi:hypothetical protein